MSYLGIDIGTSCVKVVLINDAQRCLAETSVSLTISRPYPLWSEQEPIAWWQAVKQAVLTIKANHKDHLSSIKAIGLTGQMHGAVCLAKNNDILRPAILWNDNRSHAECVELNRHPAGFLKINGNMVMPGFTAPKILWLKHHEPRIFSQIHKVLLPKDYIRLQLSGDYASDLSDSSGTSWLDVGKRCWSKELLAATGLTVEQMPKVYEGTQVTGELRKDWAAEWGIKHPVSIVAGGGDNAAGAISIGVINAERAMLSLGTSGVYFVVTDKYQPAPQGNFHTFCHCIPHKWHEMGVILSAASCLNWWSHIVGKNEAELIAEAEQSGNESHTPIFLPYLSGERTPHNNPFAQGVFFGITHNTGRVELTRAVLEGVAFAMNDCQKLFKETGTEVEKISVIGGGARSKYWGQILANILNKPLYYHDESLLGPAFGAARLAIIAFNKLPVEQVAKEPDVSSIIRPKPDMHQMYLEKFAKFSELYQKLKSSFSEF
jgi:xylulokinase